jgi:PilZ domain
MECMVPMLSEQDLFIQRMNLRQSVREVVTMRMIAADQAGPAIGEVIDITTRGCGLRLMTRLTKPLRRGQCLTLKVYPNNGTAPVRCDRVQVQWVKEERAGVTFLGMSLENTHRLHRLCGNPLKRENETVPGNISRGVAGSPSSPSSHLTQGLPQYSHSLSMHAEGMDQADLN